MHPSARLPLSNMSAYIGSTPKAPLDPGTIEFIKGKPAITQEAKSWRVYEMTIIHNEEVNAKILVEYKESGAWRERYKTWRDACEPLGLSRRRIDELIQEESESRRKPPIAPLSEVEETLETVNDLPDPLAYLERPTVHAGPAPKPKANEPLENGETVADYKRTHRPPTDNGKPIYAMPVWREMEVYCGKLLNRVDMAHHLLPDKKEHDGIIEDVHGVGERIRRWHERAKK